MYRKKMFRIMPPTTYSKVIEIGQDCAFVNNYQKYSYLVLRTVNRNRYDSLECCDAEGCMLFEYFLITILTILLFYSNINKSIICSNIPHNRAGEPATRSPPFLLR